MRAVPEPSQSTSAVEASTLRPMFGASPLSSDGSSAEADICDHASSSRRVCWLSLSFGPSSAALSLPGATPNYFDLC